MIAPPAMPDSRRHAKNQASDSGNAQATKETLAGIATSSPRRTRPTDYEVRLVMHPDLRRTARVQAVADLLSAAFGRAAP